ncbi:hypothetical protein Tsubulata_015971 [Turnera subulata]|uniref:Cytochrome P450 n=1 Tax=Turnera subulata TaxID=218843 RepID=A0A9Q0FH30_9ROSI|nr:hypothetical protein Tsubulata_015971 [Turnera subulata]
MEVQTLPLPLILVVILPTIYVLLKCINGFSSSRRKPLPPGPKGWPIVGSLPHIGKLPHISMAKFSQIYGPFISVKLGSRVVVVASSPATATEILKTHDRLFATRLVPDANKNEGVDLNRMGLLFAPECTDSWKVLRALCRTELLSVRAVESQAGLREKKVGEMVKYLERREGSVVNIGELVFAIVYNILGNVIFSRDLIDLEGEGVSGGLIKSLISQAVHLIATPNVSDLYPGLASLDLQGLRRKVSKCYKEMCTVWEGLVEERRKTLAMGGASEREDFLDVFLANGFDKNQINWLTTELFVAGSDTTTVTVEWAMAELLKNREVMRKVCEEIESELRNKPFSESHVSQLPYLNACIKETLRMHPAAPFLLPRQALETWEVMGYTIPKGAQVLVNVWAIARDPSMWDDPLSFKPERFLDSNVDYKGHHYEFLPFGSGRRTCVGIPMASKQVALILASLLHYFDWSLPNGGDPTELDVTEKFGIVLQKEKPLLFVPTRKP